jgi:outer membrane protein assembly factor BamB
MKSGSVACVVVLLLLVLAVSDFTLLSPLNSVFAAPTNVNSMASPESLLQYEWPQFQGDSSFTHFSAGPAPEAPDVVWTTTLPDIQSYVTAFNGKLFVTTSTQVIALDKDTGSILWTTTVTGPDRWPTVYKIDETHLIAGKTCLNIETGDVLWVSQSFSPSASDFEAGCYSPQQKLFYIKDNSMVQAWNFSNPAQPPTLAWQTFVAGGGDAGSGVQYGDGKVFVGSLLPHQVALDAQNGSLLWDTETKSSMLFSGCYYDGKFLRGGAHDNTYYCFDANTGKILWNYTAETADGYWASGSAAAYGMVFATNMDGYLYALDVNTGTVVWKYSGPSGFYFPGYPTVADGKVYVTTSQTAAGGVNSTELGVSEFACFDAFTGKVVWTLPIEAYAPRESVAVAYGNLYLIPGSVEQGTMDSYVTLSQVWALGTQSWGMYLKDSQHSATGYAGPMNLTLRWNFTTNGAVTSSPSAADGKVFVGSQDHYVYSLNARTGTLLWKFKTDGRIESSPAVSDGRLFIVSDDGFLYSLNASTGGLLWKQYVGSNLQVTLDSTQQIRSSPAVINGNVYVGSLNGNLYCLDAQTGYVDWTFDTNGTITSSPAVGEDAVYVTSKEPSVGVLYKISLKGTFVWRLDLEYNVFQPSDMSGSPVISGAMVYLSANGVLYGINGGTGAFAWMYEASSGSFLGSPVCVDGQLFFTDGSSAVCVEAGTGVVVWQNVLGSQCFAAPTFAGGKIYLASDMRSVYVLNASDGQKLSFFTLGSNVWSSPTIYEGRLYVGDQDWNLYCLANYPPISSNMTLALNVDTALTGDLVTGHGHLNPELENATVTVILTNPDGSNQRITATTSANGTFTFSFMPELVGNWTVVAQWESDKSFYLSTASEKVTLTIENPPTPTPTETPPPTETPTETPSPSATPIPFDDLKFFGIPALQVYLVIVSVLMGIIVVSAYIYVKKTKP